MQKTVVMLGIDRDEKKRRHFTLLHENIEFCYHHENHGKIYWACKVAGCPGMVEEDHYKMKLIRNHDHSRAVKIPPSKVCVNTKPENLEIVPYMYTINDIKDIIIINILVLLMFALLNS